MKKAMQKKTFVERQLEAVDRRIDGLATISSEPLFTLFRLTVLKDKALYPLDWKKRSKQEQERWMTETVKRLKDKLKGIDKELAQLNKFTKSLNK